jgi:hypothetical protein
MSVTLRDLPPQVERALAERAAREGLSLNRTVIRMLEESLGLTAKPLQNRDFDAFPGAWSAAQADEFDQNLAEQSQIDWELWK